MCLRHLGFCLASLHLRTVWSPEKNASGRSSSCMNPFLHVVDTEKNCTISVAGLWRLIFHLFGNLFFSVISFFLYVRHRIMTDGKAIKVIDLYKVVKKRCDELGTRCSIFLEDQPNVVSYQSRKSC